VWRYRVSTTATRRCRTYPTISMARGAPVLDGRSANFFGGESFGQGHDSGASVLAPGGGGKPLGSGRADAFTGERGTLPRLAVKTGRFYAVGGQHGHDEGLSRRPLLDVLYDPANAPGLPLGRHAGGREGPHRSMGTPSSSAAASSSSPGEISYVTTTRRRSGGRTTRGPTLEELTRSSTKRHSGIAAPMLGGVSSTHRRVLAETGLGVRRTDRDPGGRPTVQRRAIGPRGGGCHLSVASSFPFASSPGLTGPAGRCVV
jgi:hypothetical protein